MMRKPLCRRDSAQGVFLMWVHGAELLPVSGKIHKKGLTGKQDGSILYI